MADRMAMRWQKDMADRTPEREDGWFSHAILFLSDPAQIFFMPSERI